MFYSVDVSEDLAQDVASKLALRDCPEEEGRKQDVQEFLQ